MGLFKVILELILSWFKWVERAPERAKKDYASWRSQVETKKARRSRAASDLVRSVDDIVRQEDKLLNK